MLYEVITVTVASVKIKLKDGEGSIGGLKIANPSGFSDSTLFQLGNITTKIRITSYNVCYTKLLRPA